MRERESGSAAVKRTEPTQVKCLTGDDGHVWIGSYDRLPPKVRQRLRNSPFNLCAACLEAFFLPKVPPGYSREQALFAAIEDMEAQVRNEMNEDQRREDISARSDKP
jgi:hypothetical protein